MLVENVDQVKSVANVFDRATECNSFAKLEQNLKLIIEYADVC